LACSEDDSRRYVTAAVREVFEETGILIASRRVGDPIVDGGSSRFVNERGDVSRGDLGFTSFLAAQGLSIRADLLEVWGHWTTPSTEPLRYDARFFVAEVPRACVAGYLPTEADRGEWIALGDLFAMVDSGEIKMMPPTLVTCLEISRSSGSDLLDVARRREVTRVDHDLTIDECPRFVAARESAGGNLSN
jgi:8-oxo-dGTP pyrophosphatase MutT (NUDIX family)